jgi:hypothetical protein
MRPSVGDASHRGSYFNFRTPILMNRQVMFSKVVEKIELNNFVEHDKGEN